MKRIFSLFAAMTAFLTACSHDSLTMLTGSYNEPDETGIRSFRFNQETGEAVLLDSVVTRNPSYLTPSANGKYVYSVNELTPNGEATVSAFRFKKKDGSFKEIGSVPAGGGDPCYIATDGKRVVTANYSGGSLSVFPLGRGGKLKERTQLFYGAAGGPDTVRQARPHVHCVLFTPDGNHLVASDFSADRLLVFPVSEQGVAADSTGEALAVPLEADYGPRHIVFSPDGKTAYVLGELSGKITVFDYADGLLAAKQTVDADPYDGRGSADIHLSPDGKFLYASNRLVNDGIAVFKVDKHGLLEQTAYQATRIHPRNFIITPNGKYLLCACRDSGMIQVFSRDRKTGLLTDTGRDILLPKPVCIRFL